MHKIALIGCGGISAAHLEAYSAAQLEVVLLCDRTVSKAAARRDVYYPNAEITSQPEVIWSRDDISVVDITTHPVDRIDLIEQAICRGFAPLPK